MGCCLTCERWGLRCVHGIYIFSMCINVNGSSTLPSPPITVTTNVRDTIFHPRYRPRALAVRISCYILRYNTRVGIFFACFLFHIHAPIEHSCFQVVGKGLTPPPPTQLMHNVRPTVLDVVVGEGRRRRWWGGRGGQPGYE